MGEETALKMNRIVLLQILREASLIENRLKLNNHLSKDLQQITKSKILTIARKVKTYHL